jgi:hypothetical protein
MHKMNHFGCKLEVYGCQLNVQIRNQKPLINNHVHLFMHFLAMGWDGQVTTCGCNGQVISSES